MREIKFRAWTGKQMFLQDDQYLASFVRRAVTQICADTDGTLSSGHESYLPNGGNLCEYLMQYTGLKDKNGVEIYEGDIFRLDDDMALAVVEYTNDMDEQAPPAAEFCLALYEYGKRSQRLSIGEFYIDRCEVIGNIYESPELLQ